MLIALHKNATTTPAVCAAIQKATGSDYELARQLSVSRDTIRKWRPRVRHQSAISCALPASALMKSTS